MTRRSGRWWTGAATAAICTRGLTVPVWGAAPPIRIVVDDVPVSVIPPAFLQGGTVYLPLAPLARRFQATTKFTPPAVDIQRLDGSTLTVRLDRLEVWSGDGVSALLEAPVRLVNSGKMIPRCAEAPWLVERRTWAPEASPTHMSARDARRTRHAA